MVRAVKYLFAFLYGSLITSMIWEGCVYNEDFLYPLIIVIGLPLLFLFRWSLENWDEE